MKKRKYDTAAFLKYQMSSNSQIKQLEKDQVHLAKDKVEQDLQNFHQDEMSRLQREIDKKREISKLYLLNMSQNQEMKNQGRQQKK